MKKLVLIITIISSVLLGVSNVEAKVFTYDSYKSLGIKGAYVVGDYIFDLDNGYSPSLQDFMIASRTIEDDKPTTLYSYQIFSLFDSFRQLEVYSNEQTRDKTKFKVFQAKYIYRANIRTAKQSDYDVLS